LLVRPPNKRKLEKRNKKNVKLLDVLRKKPQRMLLQQEQMMLVDLKSPVMAKRPNQRKERSQRTKRRKRRMIRALERSPFSMVDQQKGIHGLRHLPTFKSSFPLSSWVCQVAN
jgi:hypothetical protein